MPLSSVSEKRSKKATSNDRVGQDQSNSRALPNTLARVVSTDVAQLLTEALADLLILWALGACSVSCIRNDLLGTTIDKALLATFSPLRAHHPSRPNASPERAAVAPAVAKRRFLTCVGVHDLCYRPLGRGGASVDPSSEWMSAPRTYELPRCQGASGDLTDAG